jgi:hypothetical protein
MCELTVSSLESIGIAVQEKMNKNYTMILISKDSSTCGFLVNLLTGQRLLFNLTQLQCSTLQTNIFGSIRNFTQKAKKIRDPDLI